jgi:hypothetical protein
MGRQSNGSDTAVKLPGSSQTLIKALNLDNRSSQQ